jgi:hypothetical protein
MKVNQISGMLNDVFKSVLGEDGLIAEDLSNVVDAGRVITGSEDVFGPNFDNYVAKIIDKVGRTIFWDRVYTADDLGIWRDSWEYGSVLEKIRCEVGTYEDNCEWDLTKNDTGTSELDYNEGIAGHIAEMFKFYPAKVQAKYFNSKTTFKTTISITRKQLKSAFNSASDLSRFIGMIEQRVRSKMEISKNQLQKMVIANLMGEHIYQGKQVIDLAALYAAETGQTAGTLKAALTNGDKVRYIAQKMTFFREMMSEPSKLYSASGEFWNHTPIADSRLIILADLDSSLKFNTYATTYNEEYTKLEGYRVVPFWQTAGTSISDTLGTRSAINITTSNGNVVAKDNILGVLFDRDAAMIANEDPDVRAVYNADGNFTNYMYCSDCSYYNDFDENCIVFVWDGVATDELSFKPTLTAGETKDTTIVNASGLPSGTVYAKASDGTSVAEIGAAVPTGYSSITAGTTEIDVTEGQYVNVAIVNNSVVTAVGAVKVTKEDIGVGE